MNGVATNIIHLQNKKLKYYGGALLSTMQPLSRCASAWASPAAQYAFVNDGQNHVKCILGGITSVCDVGADVRALAC